MWRSERTHQQSKSLFLSLRGKEKSETVYTDVAFTIVFYINRKWNVHWMWNNNKHIIQSCSIQWIFCNRSAVYLHIESMVAKHWTYVICTPLFLTGLWTRSGKTKSEVIAKVSDFSLVLRCSFVPLQWFDFSLRTSERVQFRLVTNEWETIRTQAYNKNNNNKEQRLQKTTRRSKRMRMKRNQQNGQFI